MIVSMVSMKGGVGKSTIAVSLAAQWHKEGLKVLVIDADPQGTVAQWGAVARSAGHDGPEVITLTGANLRRELTRRAKGIEAVVIDTPPRLATEARSAALVSNLVLVPLGAGPADLWSAKETLTMVAEARALRPDLAAGLVLVRIDPRTALGRASVEAAGKLGLPLLGQIGNRVAFGEAMASGLGVADYAPRSPAAVEIEALARAVEQVARRAS
jgi:chromosome partitioning protein